MSDAFVVYVRHGEKVLIMQRSDEVADFPGAWDGVYGVGILKISTLSRLELPSAQVFPQTHYNMLGRVQQEVLPLETV